MHFRHLLQVGRGQGCVEGGAGGKKCKHVSVGRMDNLFTRRLVGSEMAAVALDSDSDDDGDNDNDNEQADDDDDDLRSVLLLTGRAKPNRAGNNNNGAFTIQTK